MISTVIPLGIAVPPFYFSSGPAYVNYGKLGRTIGHEIAHGFDSTGITYDADGNLRDWLSPEDQRKFEENAKCFVEQYNQFEVLPGKRINGSFTLDENIADNLGLELAYRGYKRSVQDDGQVEQPKKLFGLEKLSPKQLFFLSYAAVSNVRFTYLSFHKRLCSAIIIITYFVLSLNDCSPSVRHLLLQRHWKGCY